MPHDPHHLKLRSHCVHCHVTLILSCTQAVAAFLVQSLPRDWCCWERNGWALPSYTNFHLLSDANRPAPVLHPSSSALPVRSMRQEGKGSGTGHVPPVRPLRSPYQPFATANGSNSAEMSTLMAPPLVPNLAACTHSLTVHTCSASTAPEFGGDLGNATRTWCSHNFKTSSCVFDHCLYSSLAPFERPVHRLNDAASS